MSLTFRNRTNGFGSWINYSASKKGGARASVSTKLSKNVTANLSKDGVKATVNLGNGFRYTWKPTLPKSEHSNISEFFEVEDSYDVDKPSLNIFAKIGIFILLFLATIAILVVILLIKTGKIGF